MLNSKGDLISTSKISDYITKLFYEKQISENIIILTFYRIEPIFEKCTKSFFKTLKRKIVLTVYMLMKRVLFQIIKINKV
jgi:hypothetical protein